MFRSFSPRVITASVLACAVCVWLATPAVAGDAHHTPPSFDDNLDITDSHATHTSSEIIFEQIVQGVAGGTKPVGVSPQDGAPVLGYVFPTTLAPSDIGFSNTPANAGTVALAVTSHPDFDDTPLADENGNTITTDDGGEWHSHWVVLVGDVRVAGGLSVKRLDLADQSIVLPPTHPGLPLFIDSPDYQVDLTGDTVKVHVPLAGLNNRIDFNFDAVTAYLEVHGDAEPLLGVYQVYDVLSGNLSLPLTPVPEPTSAALLTLGLLALGRSMKGRKAKV